MPASSDTADAMAVRDDMDALMLLAERRTARVLAGWLAQIAALRGEDLPFTKPAVVLTFPPRAAVEQQRES